MAEAGRLMVAVRHRIGAVSLDVEFTLANPWTVLFAPSGAGKSTVLRIVAGLVRPDSGTVVWTPPSGERCVLTDTERGIFVPPHRRVIRFVGQQTALFPHQTVLDNVMYGMDRSLGGRGHRAALAQDFLSLCRIEPLAARTPAELSGGERQRVAIARALAATGCRVLLLDEPFSALDSAMRQDLLGTLRPWLTQRAIPVLHVTHDIGEVLALGAEVLRMSAGKVSAQGPAHAVLREEQAWLAKQLRVVDSPSGI